MKKILIRIITAVLIGAVVFFLAKEIAENWEAIRSYHFDFNLRLLIAASSVYGASFLVLAFGWAMSLRLVGAQISLLDAVLYFCVTQPGKYVPGKIWIAVARTRLCEKHGISHAVTFLSTGVEGFFEIVAGTYISIFALLQIPGLKAYSLAGVMLISAAGVLIMIPRIFYSLVNLYLRLLKKAPLDELKRMSAAALLQTQLIFIAAMFGIGLAQALFLQSFEMVDAGYLPVLVSIGVFSYVASILAFFSPSGLGVREGVWIAGLRGIVAQPVAVIYAFVSRLWTILVEAVLVAICLPFVWKRARKLPSLPHQS